MKTKHLYVSTPQGASGSLHKESRFSFRYETRQPECEVSLVMPLRAESYASGGLFSVFAMNRPEGYLLDAIRMRFAKHRPIDDMELLSLTGKNQIGRLSYTKELNETDERPSQVSIDELVKSNASDELFEFLVDIYFDSGVSGFQPKVLMPARAVSEKSTLRVADLIVKSAGDDYPFLAQNEFLCMEAARLAQIRVPDYWLSEDGKLFIMSRFDIDRNGRQLGFEDMTVLMGKSPEEKYHGSYEGIAKAIDLFCGEHRQESKARLFDYVALSCLCKNGDGHLKNFALIYDQPGVNVRLSPLYDVVTTSAYAMINPRTGATRVDRTLALNLNKEKSYPSMETLCAFGSRSCGVRHPERVVEHIREAQRQALTDNKARIDPDMWRKISNEWGCNEVFRPRRTRIGF